MKSRLKYLTALCLLIGMLGCAKARVYCPADGPSNAPTSGDSSSAQIYRDKIKQLEQDLKALNTTVDQTEAQITAETAVRESAALVEKYELVRPALAHNLLVALGIKDRGLCYHWTEDLMERLHALNLRSFQLYWAVAYRGSELREHNCVVITAAGQGFRQGIVLDPWRDSGNLYWTRVSQDRYPWKELPRCDW